MQEPTPLPDPPVTSQSQSPQAVGAAGATELVISTTEDQGLGESTQTQPVSALPAVQAAVTQSGQGVTTAQVSQMTQPPSVTPPAQPLTGQFVRDPTDLAPGKDLDRRAQQMIMDLISNSQRQGFWNPPTDSAG